MSLEAVLGDPSLARRPTTAFVSRAALRHNLGLVRDRIGPHRQVMAVVKANAYGHGLIETARTLVTAGIDALGVAFLEEGIALRRAGVRVPILVLGGLIGNQVRHFIENDLDLTGASPFKLRQIDEVARSLGRTARVHLLVDTGMERLGIHAENAERLLDAAAAAQSIEVVGLFSHLAQSEASDPGPTAHQLRRFDRVVRLLEPFGLRQVRCHLANSGGVLCHGSELWYDMVRPGLCLYGVGPRGPHPDLEPAMRLETRVVYFKVVPRGAGVGYGATWRADHDTRVVTLPVGYGDGLPRALSNRGLCIIRGRRVPFVGTVTMDATMVDVGPQGTAYNDDPAILFGKGQGTEVRVEELAERAGLIPYEILCGLSQRVPRVYEDPD